MVLPICHKMGNSERSMQDICSQMNLVDFKINGRRQIQMDDGLSESSGITHVILYIWVPSKRMKLKE